MLIKGLQKLTLLDYPEKVACTVFMGGCNFACPFCHNASLVLGDRVRESETMPEEEFFSFLNKRRGILEAVCISGGEPTLGSDLIPFLNNIKELGVLVKLDTNGYRPDVLRKVINGGLCDYVAMDIKNSPDMYGITVGLADFDVKPIMESAHLLMSSELDFEFRTTLVRELHKEDDVLAIGKWLAGPEKYFLQTFKDSGDLISSDLGGYNKNETETLLNLLLPYIPNTQIRS